MPNTKIYVSELTSAIKAGAYYLLHRGGGIGGQMCTNWVCIGCGYEFSHANTATPIICKACASIIAHAAETLAQGIAKSNVHLPLDIVVDGLEPESQSKVQL